MHILVTGGAGFIGSHLVRTLVEQQHQVRVLDNLSSGQRDWLGPALDAIDFIEGDITNPDTVMDAVAGVDLVFHLAAMVSVNESLERPLYTYAVNVTGSLHVLEAARLHGVRRVVQMSSSAVYGDNERLPVSEADQPMPLSPYASTKLAAEQAGQLYSRLYDIEVVALRGFNIYGPRQSPSSPYAAVIPRFIAALRAGKQITIFGDGYQSRDFIYVGDVVRALWMASQAPNIGGEVFNMGSGQAYSIRDMAQMLGDLLDTEIDPIFAPPREGEVRHSCAAVERFAERAGFRSAIDLRQGLTQTLAVTE